MQAIILAAGEGSRMRPLTRNRPKVMLPVAGRPLLEEIILRAASAGVDRFVVVVGYRKDAIIERLRDGSSLGVQIDYAVQKEQLGTADALAAARELSDGRFIVMNGDVLSDVKAIRSMVKSEGLAAAGFIVKEPKRYGVFMVRDGIVSKVIEKSENPPSNLANAGIYLLDSDIFPILEGVTASVRGEIELTDALNVVAAKREVHLVELENWHEVGRPWDLLEVGMDLLAVKETYMLGELEGGCVLKGSVCIGSGTIVRSGAYIEGPTAIGEHCDIGPNCYIRAGSCIGDNVRIGNAVEIKNSTIMQGTKIGHLSYLGDSVIGACCNFGAGTIVSNLRHDGMSIKSYIKGQGVDSGRRKLGVIMGDGVKTGIHTSIYPGTVIEPGYQSRPGAILRGYLSTKP